MGGLRQKRNYGIDLLRFISMYFIIVLHFLTQGCIIDHSHGINLIVISIIEAFVYSGVDIFALISGYCGYAGESARNDNGKYLEMWFQVFYYSLGIALIFVLSGKEYPSSVLLFSSAFPVTSTQYWYFTSYSFLYFLMPYINRLVFSQTEYDRKISVYVVFIIFILYGCAVSLVADPLRIRQGHSFLWLATLYYLGAVIKIDNVYKYYSKKKLLCILLSSALFTVASRIVMPRLSQIIIGREIGFDFLYKDISPTIVLISFSVLGLFQQYTPNKCIIKLVSYFTPAVFGVYLIHVHPLVLKHFFNGNFIWLADKNVFVVITLLLVYSLLIFVGAILLDTIRILLFRLFKVRVYTARINAVAYERIKHIANYNY